MTDILERLKQTTKINGAYPRDIADAIKEIVRLRNEVEFYGSKRISDYSNYQSHELPRGYGLNYED